MKKPKKIKVIKAKLVPPPPPLPIDAGADFVAILKAELAQPSPRKGLVDTINRINGLCYRIANENRPLGLPNRPPKFLEELDSWAFFPEDPGVTPAKLAVLTTLTTESTRFLTFFPQ